MLFFGSPFGQAETRVTGPTSTKLVQTHKTFTATQSISMVVFVAFSVSKRTQVGMSIEVFPCGVP